MFTTCCSEYFQIEIQILFFFLGNMVDLTGSSPANGYTHRVSPCPSPGAMVNKGLSRQSPPSRQHNMRPMMPNSRANMLSPDPVSIKILSKFFITF